PDQCEGHSDGESWEPQPCEYCYCADGIKACATPSCALPPCAVELEEGEGVCCPTCPEPLVPLTACGNYSDGDEWSPDPCSRCICNEGVSECNLVVCPELGCISPKSVEGECCQQCLAPLHFYMQSEKLQARNPYFRARYSQHKTLGKCRFQPSGDLKTPNFSCTLRANRWWRSA
ncbi:putative cysteine-rich motor neuron 1 protein, partial [Apostichopus japonicus]